MNQTVDKLNLDSKLYSDLKYCPAGRVPIRSAKIRPKLNHLGHKNHKT